MPDIALERYDDGVDAHRACSGAGTRTVYAIMRRPPLPRHARLARSAPLFIVVALAATPGAAAAQGRTSAVLLELPAGARVAAMGDAGGAIGGVGGLPYNPAIIANLRGPSAEFSVERYLGRSTIGALSAGLPIGRGAIGVTILTLRYPEAAEVVASPTGGDGIETGGQVRGHDAVVGLGWGMRLHERLHAGATAKWVGQSLPGASGSTVAGDFGLAVGLVDRRVASLALTAALQHVGADIEMAGSAAPLPRTSRVGLAVEHGRSLGLHWIAAAEATRGRDGAVRPRGGLEVGRDVGRLALVARAGAVARGSGTTQDPVTLGAGVKNEVLALDYAWRRFGPLGSTHRFGVRWQP